MNRKLAALLVALSIVLGVGVVLVVQRFDGGDTGGETPSAAPDSRADSPSPSPTTDPDVSSLLAANREDRAAAGLASWSPADPLGPDGEPLMLGNIVLGGIEPVKVGDEVSGYVRQGYLGADQDPPCEGNHWLWAGQLSEGLFVSATKDGTITALGTDRDGLETADGIGVGNSMRALKATYGEFLAQVRTDDQGGGWSYVKEGDGWLAFSLGPVDQVTDSSRVDFVEVGTGEVLHHFNDAC